MGAGGRLRRVVIVGATGAGKSSLALRLAAAIEAPYVELDALFWGPKWTPPPPEDFRARVAAATASPAWVVAGNYNAVRDLLWPRADTIVWLDYSFPLVLGRLTARTLRRGITRERLWNGNRENLWEHAMVWSEHSLFNWLFTTFWRYRREFPALFREPAHAHARVVHLRTPRAAREWLAIVEAARSSRAPGRRRGRPRPSATPRRTDPRAARLPLGRPAGGHPGDHAWSAPRQSPGARLADRRNPRHRGALGER